MASRTARRKLGIELKKLREAAGLKIDEAAKAAGISDSHLSRTERGQVGVRPLTLKALLAVYSADVEVAAPLLQISAETTKRADRGWWRPYAFSISEKYADLLAFESEAASIREFSPTLVPGLLQTEEYARASLRRGDAGAASPPTKDGRSARGGPAGDPVRRWRPRRRARTSGDSLFPRGRRCRLLRDVRGGCLSRGGSIVWRRVRQAGAGCPLRQWFR